MSTDYDAKLRCPICGSKDRFTVTAEVSITVGGNDYLEILDENGDREYGSESTCSCKACGHVGTMGEFYSQDQEST